MTALPGAFLISQYKRLADILDRSGKATRGGSLGMYSEAGTCIQVCVHGDSLRQRDAGSICVERP